MVSRVYVEKKPGFDGEGACGKKHFSRLDKGQVEEGEHAQEEHERPHAGGHAPHGDAAGGNHGQREDGAQQQLSGGGGAEEPHHAGKRAAELDTGVQRVDGGGRVKVLAHVEPKGHGFSPPRRPAPSARRQVPPA